MRRTALTLLPLLALASAITIIALAQNVHFKKGSPRFTDTGKTLCATGSLVGLGNGDVTITVSSTGAATSVTCTSPGGNEAPGQNPAPVNVTGAQVIPEDEIKNGNVTFSVCTAQPTLGTPKQSGCPNNNWTATLTDVQFSNATVTVEQNGQTVLQQSFSCSGGNGSLSCSPQ
jgi:hypothetical protein